MSGDKRYLLSKVSAGSGRVLDLGGGVGALGSPLRARGYRYVNVDLAPRGPNSVVGDAHRLPFADGAFELIVSGDSLEHFPEPRLALEEAWRVLGPDGRFVAWVPFMHPFHTDDFYRYTPLGLRYLLEGAGFVLNSLEAPLGGASVVAQLVVHVARRVGLGRAEPSIERAAAWIDRHAGRLQTSGVGFAAAYLVVATRARET
jgi:SAM-dependent methyltransferase